MRKQIALLSILFVLVLSVSAQDYQFRTVGSLGGGRSQAVAINSSGQVVGSSRTSSKAVHAFLWSRKGGMQDLGTLAGTTTSIATGINDQGDVVGCSLASPPRVFLWTTGAGPEELGTTRYLGTGGFLQNCRVSINNLGVVVWSKDFPGNIVRWTRAGGIEDLGFAGTPAAVNDSGQIAGLFGGGAGPHAFLWTEGTGVQDLGTLHSWSSSYGFGLNAAGDVVGVSFGTFGSDVDGFLWTGSSGMQPLGLVDSEAVSINNHGQFTGDQLGGPLLWTAPGDARDLYHELPANVRNNHHSWSGVGINDAGQVIVSDRVGLPANAILLTPKMQVALGSSSNPSHVGQSVTFTATVSSIQGTPPNGEKVIFKDGTKKLASVSLTGGTATFSTSGLNAGTHSISAQYAGDVNYLLTKSLPVTQVVNP